MIKFFRHIRRSLIQENQMGKYFKYAIGEILLVVIGILIALQFNNWNELRKHQQAISESISAIEEDLAYNFRDATRTLQFFKQQDTIMKKVLFNQYTLEDYRTNDLISIVTANWNVHTPKTENLDALLQREEYITKELQPIIDDVKVLLNRKALVDQSWATLYNNIEENIEKLTQDVSLVKLDSASLEKRYTYMLTQPEYSKIVEINWVHTQNYYDLLSRLRAQNMAVLSTIKTVRENYGTKELEKLYHSFGMNPFKKVDCNIENITNNSELRRGYLVGNLSNKETSVRITNDGKIGGTYTLKPNEFRQTRPEYAGLGGDYTIIIEQINENDTCINKYVAVNKGYLLIE